MADDFVDYDVPRKPMPEARLHKTGLVTLGRKLATMGVSKEVKEALEAAGKAQLRGATPTEIDKLTGGVAQVGMHGKPISIIPHGDVKMLARGSFDEGLRLGDVYRSKNLEREFPELMDVTIAPDPTISPRSAYIQQGNQLDKGTIYAHPGIFQDTESAKRILSHEMTHGGALLSEGRLGPLGGTDPHYIHKQASLPLSEQVQLAGNVRRGQMSLKDLPKHLRSSSNFAGLLKMPDSSLEDLAVQAQILKMIRQDPVPSYYNTYGEQLAYWMMNPKGGRETRAIPHLTESWEGPRHMESTRRKRLLSQSEDKPSSLLADDFQVLLDNYYSSQKP